MTLTLYNTLTRQLELFVPRDPGRVAIYCCGPTVYDVPHVGHTRGPVVLDVLVRHLKASGYSVTYVRNVTDVDDKILDRAREAGQEPLALSDRMAAIYQNQMRAVGCQDPSAEPRVSEHLPEVIELVSRLIAHGAAYVVSMPRGTSDVYFSVRSFPDYGKLSRRKLGDLKVGARVAKDANKRDPLDFALWKGATPDEWGWDSPWGRGRPGWHIECSAMSHRYLGHGFDIHAGGMDLIFPHHENEIAQSEAAHPAAGPYVRYWIHNGFVNLSHPDSGEPGDKMSKSLGNTVSIGDVLDRNDPEAVRWFLLTHHYRGPIQFDVARQAQDRLAFPGIDEAESRVDYLHSALRRLHRLAETRLTAPAPLPPDLARAREAAAAKAAEARAALDDDLNTPMALTALGELASLGNELADLAAKRRKDATWSGAAATTGATLLQDVQGLCNRLGLAQVPSHHYFDRTRARRLASRGLTADQVEAKIQERTQARHQRDFQRADAVRDTPDGTDWSVVP
ncbi:cysteine--tRNA ligase [Myxococcota bacterium]